MNSMRPGFAPKLSHASETKISLKSVSVSPVNVPRPTAIVLPRGSVLRIAQIHQPVLRELRMQFHEVQQVGSVVRRRRPGRWRRRLPRGLRQELAVPDDTQASGTLGHEDRACVGKHHAERMHQAVGHQRDLDPLSVQCVEREWTRATWPFRRSLPLSENRTVERQAALPGQQRTKEKSAQSCGNCSARLCESGRFDN